MENEKYDLYSEFDLEKHKRTYVNYLEVMIDRDGKVLYAVPSHQQKAIEMACAETGWSRHHLWEACPDDMRFDVLEWLLSLTGAVAVWNYNIAGTPNAAQRRTLRELAEAGVYKGPLSAGKVQNVQCDLGNADVLENPVAGDAIFF